MKALNKILLIAFLILFLTDCKSKTQKEAEQTAMNIAKTMEETTSESEMDPNGFYMKATIDGKKWVAAKMGPRYGAGSDYKLIGGETEDITINFQLHKPHPGMKREFSDDYAANFITDDGFFGGKKGEVTVTGADDKWIEGSFYFTATSSSSTKTYQVTNGFFKIPNN